MRVTSLSLMMEVKILHIQILTGLLLIVTANGEPRFFNLMENLMDMNRRILQQNHKEQISKTTTVLPMTSRQPSENMKSTTTKSEIEKTPSKPLYQSENSHHTSSMMTEKQTVSPSVELSTKMFHDKHKPIVTKQKSENDDGPYVRILLYSGTVAGVFSVAICLIVIIMLYKKRQQQLKKTRFSSTDQKTYKDTKIFVMANKEKPANIIDSFNAIPANTTLWKDLQTSSPNVF